MCLFSFSSIAQTSFRDFFKLSPPKRTWVLFHPFKAKKALQVSKEAQQLSDSIKKTSLFDGDASGGQVDAFRHAYWMARLKDEIGLSAARSLGKAHEKENYRSFKKGTLEDGVLPDYASSEMDLWNNEIGLNLVDKRTKLSKNALLYRVINAIKLGKMRVLKKDTKGRFLDCNGEVIPQETLQGKWKNNKCLVPSNTNIYNNSK